ncbi:MULTISPECIES: amino acid permease [Paraburkholderia]|uniref:amino acid permease n=1 Tax=Paraburkholderia TaxID=1822464 RepID=UPI002255E5DC|nr:MULTISPECIES: amino acid permease [Paraburkholderia]MCX4163881.1 amino acid permease [Paraburkholderia megapolitana]MDN7159376.1 amino acid permease [Paraburkholderia sp. CHISQ3]MDQ6496423.1 amino acid permease [Paraburkholderia megapolitana]
MTERSALSTDLPPGSATGVSYQDVSDKYFEQRQLQRHAGFFTLLVLGVGAVIAGQYSGWNLGLSQGFGGMLAATLIIAVMYVFLCSSIGEMAAALPHTGGAYSFARTTMGPWGGFTTGLAENIEFVLAPAGNMFFMGAYLGAIFGTPADAQPLWWIAGYAVMLLLSMRGLGMSMRVVVIVTIAAVAVLAFFCLAAIPHVDFAYLALNLGADSAGKPVELPAGHGPWLPFGATGIMLALPFAVYMFLAIEQLPLTAEEAHNPTKHMPMALMFGILILAVLALSIVFFSASIPNGAFALSTSGEPLLDGFRSLFGHTASKILAGVAVLGLAASFLAGSFAAGRNIYSLSRAGYLPTALSVTHPVKKTPNRALCAGSLLALGVLMAFWFTFGRRDNALMGGVLVSMIVFAGMISYIFQSLSYIRLRSLHAGLKRPFKSPFGIFGAVVTILIAGATLLFQFVDPVYKWAALGAAVWYLLGLSYFGLYRRHHLVLSPEEAFAVSGGRRGMPD